MEFIILFIVAVVAGVIGSLVGLGGGAILIPAVLFLSGSVGVISGITPQTVVGLSVVMMIFTGLSSTISYAKTKQVDYKSGFIFFIGSIPGTIVGAWVNKGLDLPSFNLYFGILLIILGIILMIRGKLKPVKWFLQHGYKREFIDNEGITHVYGYPIWFAVIFAFFVGFISGLFGLGGGSLIVPAMIILFLFPPHVAVATSMFLVFLTSIVNSASHIYLGNVPWLYTIPVIPGAYIGAKVGAYVNKRIQSDKVVFALRLVLLVLGARSIFVALL